MYESKLNWIISDQLLSLSKCLSFEPKSDDSSSQGDSQKVINCHFVLGNTRF